MANVKPEVAFPQIVDRETRETCQREIKKRVGGSVKINEKEIGGREVVVNLNGYSDTKGVFETVLSRHCRHVTVRVVA